MTDFADIWPDNYERRPKRALALTLIVDVGAHFPESHAAELRNGIRQLDLFLQQDQELRHCVHSTLISPRLGMADLDLEVIRCEPRRALDPDLNISLSSIIDAVLDNFEKASSRKSTTAHQILSHWLVLLSEGGNDADVTWASRVSEEVRNSGLTVIPVIVGEGCDSALLLALGSYRPPLRLQRGGGPRFFSWLGKELQRVVTANPEKRVYLDVAGMAAWAQT